MTAAFNKILSEKKREKKKQTTTQLQNMIALYCVQPFHLLPSHQLPLIWPAVSSRLLICFISSLLPSRHSEPLKPVVSSCSCAYNPPAFPVSLQSQGANHGPLRLTCGCLWNTIRSHTPPCHYPLGMLPCWFKTHQNGFHLKPFELTLLFLECSSPAIIP